MSYSDVVCQCCGRALNESSSFGWVEEAFTSKPINIYEKFNGINNPNNLNYCILYCNNCAKSLDEVFYTNLGRSLSDHNLRCIKEDDTLYNDKIMKKTEGFKQDYLNIRRILKRL